MNPKTAAKWIEADQYCRTHPVPSILAQAAAAKAKVAMRKAIPAKPRIRLPRGLKAKTPQSVKKDLKKELEALCKAIVFTRDCGSPEAREGNCISCLRWNVLQWGHFIRQQDSKWLQYDPRNTGGQCRQCNGFGHGNVFEYALAIDKRDGDGAAARLHAEAAFWKGWRQNKVTLGKKLEELKKHPLAPKAEGPALGPELPTAKPSNLPAVKDSLTVQPTPKGQP